MSDSIKHVHGTASAPEARRLLPPCAEYQLLPPLRPDERSQLEADIRKRGVLVPVELDEEGRILDGHHRAEIARTLGLEIPTLVRRFTSGGIRSSTS